MRLLLHSEGWTGGLALMIRVFLLLFFFSSLKNEATRGISSPERVCEPSSSVMRASKAHLISWLYHEERKGGEREKNKHNPVAAVVVGLALRGGHEPGPRHYETM